jgi:mycothiol system anti-sigma-R factor
MEQRECFTGDEEFNMYLDGELDGKRESALKKHLSNCNICSLQYEMAINMKSSLKKSCEKESAPAWLREKIMNSIRAEEPVRSGHFWESVKSLFSGRPFVPVGIAAVLIIVLASAIYYGRPGNGNMPFIGEMVHEHYEYLEEVVDLGIKSNDPNEISRWISINAGMNIQLPSGAESLVPGGACVLEMDDEDMGYVYFDKDDKRISLFIIDDKYDSLFGQKIMNLDNISIYCGNCTGMNYVLWKNADHVCVLVSELPEASLVGIAKDFI